MQYTICLQNLYPTNFLRVNVFIYLYVFMYLAHAQFGVIKLVLVLQHGLENGKYSF